MSPRDSNQSHESRQKGQAGGALLFVDVLGTKNAWKAQGRQGAERICEWFGNTLAKVLDSYPKGSLSDGLIDSDSAGFVFVNLAFRDYLRVHPEVAKEYEALKRGLLAPMGENPDRDAYNDGKTAFITAVTNRAMAEAGQ